MTKEELQNIVNLMCGNEDMRLIAFYIILNLNNNYYAKVAKTYTYNQFFNLWGIGTYVLRIRKTKKQFLVENKNNIDKIMKS